MYLAVKNLPSSFQQAAHDYSPNVIHAAVDVLIFKLIPVNFEWRQKCIANVP